MRMAQGIVRDAWIPDLALPYELSRWSQPHQHFDHAGLLRRCSPNASAYTRAMRVTDRIATWTHWRKVHRGPKASERTRITPVT